MQATQDTVERWLPVAGFEDRYEVSDRGRVRSIGFWVNGQFWPRRIRAAGVVRGGHLALALYRNSVATPRSVHSLVAAAFIGPRPEGLQVCHNNGDPQDNRVENLRYDTQSSNMLDTLLHGTNVNVNKTHCPHGHEYTPENTYRYKTSRFCRTCQREAGRRYKAKMRAGREAA